MSVSKKQQPHTVRGPEQAEVNRLRITYSAQASAN
jgi:hypothetical protein